MQVFKLKDILPSKVAGSFAGMPDFSACFQRSWREFRVFDLETCASSLDTAWELMDQGGMLAGDSVLCLEQTGGRGRMRRRWSSPRGNIYAALKLPVPDSTEMNRMLSIITGYSFQRALMARGIEVFLKWPNDLVVNSGKAGGILIEEKRGGILAGIGLNLKSLPDSRELRTGRLMDPVHLSGAWPEADPRTAWAELVYLGQFWYDNILCNYSLIDFISEVKPYLWLVNQMVRVEQDQIVLEGRLKGIDESGGIILDCAGHHKHIQTGTLLS
ncbi:biotin/acetyl-CoA-carboxylase ligase [Desulfonatronospira thiodismutans ASO3-1]|uniref:biotin--[biotin carboxyl-carrier protein] ligase n=1 Tax=Desulfonatronospira thiodismutans ASO3-1 TaxID=555779 RepID=D6SKX8_9BACT|nr:biotin--[acetyl-CoA-carboxylase] ligase [Desulfonatronospira thiodismutans]EFI35339.1 biotin/acetyl-CoA-carboxylase ligase [Desulfonatronospira thiodismutans ASO3-1]